MRATDAYGSVAALAAGQLRPVPAQPSKRRSSAAAGSPVRAETTRSAAPPSSARTTRTPKTAPTAMTAALAPAALAGGAGGGAGGATLCEGDVDAVALSEREGEVVAAGVTDAERETVGDGLLPLESVCERVDETVADADALSETDGDAEGEYVSAATGG